MNYLNKHKGTAAAYLNYQGDGKWIIKPAENNRYRILTNDDETIYALDFEGMTGMITVGSILPGYNREIKSIVKLKNTLNSRIQADIFRSEYEVNCFGW